MIRYTIYRWKLSRALHSTQVRLVLFLTKLDPRAVALVVFVVTPDSHGDIRSSCVGYSYDQSVRL